MRCFTRSVVSTMTRRERLANVRSLSVSNIWGYLVLISVIKHFDQISNRVIRCYQVL